MTLPTTDRVPVLVFRVGEQDYALTIQEVVEVAAMVAVSPVPGAPPALMGMINRHGEALPLLSMRTIFGLPQPPLDHDMLFIVVESGKRRAGLAVDSVDQVRYLPPDAIQKMSGTGQFIHQVAHDGVFLVEIIALNALLDAHFGVQYPDVTHS